jgi:hypothetical protein
MQGQDVHEILIWDTSAINALTREVDRHDLILRMSHSGIVHRIPMYVFDEIAATQSSETRVRLLEVCRELKSDSEMIILLSPWHVIEAGVRMFWEVGVIDWQILFGVIPEYENALASGHVFDDELAKIQKEQNRENLRRFEDYVAQARRNFESLFPPELNAHKTLDDITARAHATGLIERNVRYYCENILGHSVDTRDLERFSAVFLPMRAMIYTFLFGHFHRNKVIAASKPAGAIDLLASVYLPVCHGFVTDDQDQQTVLRETLRCCSFRAEVIWFSGVLREKYRSRIDNA